MKAFIVVEGRSDVAVLRAVLPNELLDASDIVVVGGRSARSSVARTLLVKYQRPLAVVIDTDTLEPLAIKETVTTTEHMLRTVAGDTPFKVIYCIPELEAIFFAAPIDLKRIFPHYDTHFFTMFAKARPKEALQYLFDNGRGPKRLPEFLDHLTSEDAEHLRSTAPIRELLAFLRDVCPVSTPDA